MLLVFHALSAVCLNTLRLIARLLCRRELHDQQPPTSGRMAAADVPSNGHKEEPPSATAAQHLGGDSGLDDSVCESRTAQVRMVDKRIQAVHVFIKSVSL